MEERKERILAFMRDNAYKPLQFKELKTVLDVPKTDAEAFKKVLGELESEGKIFKNYRNRYGVPERMNLVPGRIQGNGKGFGFLIPDEEGASDIFISADSMNGAMHNDRVVARINKKTIADKRAEGEVIRIIKRANETIVGTFETSRHFGFVIPDDVRITSDIFIPKDEFNGANHCDKVVAKIVKWPEKRRNAEGAVIEILGNKDEAGTDILSIIKAYNFNESFPEDVEHQIESIPNGVSPDMMKGRRDLRGLKMVTIDGEDAKDLDDAVSIEKLPDGKYRLGVHIADVSHYVKENSPLDREALERGNSVYLVDRVIPMLHKKLSNDICSLNAGADRLAFSVMMDIDRTGRVVSHEIFESVINVTERMTYNNVYKILVENNDELKKRYEHLVEDFEAMKDLFLILHEKRASRGSIDFGFEETKIILDEKGKPIDIIRYKVTMADQIIEEFMIVCNETVAESFFWAGIPFVYRIHEDPDSEKIQVFAELVSNLGYRLKGVNKIHPRALRELLNQVAGTGEELIISTIMLRSLAKARYSPQNSGHFGLAARFYCHFTAPIRRYPDLMIHRIMKEFLKGRINEKREEQLKEMLPSLARLCSERERIADEAERETEDLKKVEFMKEFEGSVFEGIISNVTSFGMFVELDNTVEGLVRMSSLEDDFYIYNEKQFCLIGERTKKIYRIADRVKVQLIRADTATRQIEFAIIEEVKRGEKGRNNEDNGVKKQSRKKKTDKNTKQKIARDNRQKVREKR